MMELRPIVTDADGTILGGNMRFEALQRNGVTEVPDEWIKSAETLTDDERRRFIIEDNVGFGAWDFDALGEEWTIGELTEWGVEIPKGVFGVTPRADDDDIPDEEDIEPTAQTGNIFTLGRHRVMCGDATGDDIGILMGEALAEMVFTDPPYGVGYHSADETMFYNGKKGKPVSEMVGDDEDMYHLIIPKLVEFTRGPIYVFCGAGNEIGLLDAMRASSVTVVNMLIWDKMRFGGQAMGANYKPSFELFYYVLPPKGQRRWTGPNNETTLWQVKRDTEGLHTTQKPVELVTRAVGNHDAATVLDPFLGSGSTLIACEKLNRTCYGMEIDPHYVDVIIKRWEDYTGEKAVRADG